MNELIIIVMTHPCFEEKEEEESVEGDDTYKHSQLRALTDKPSLPCSDNNRVHQLYKEF